MIVHDLQTRKRYYFICSKWLALDRDDCQIDRVLAAAGSTQKLDIKYLIEKQTKDKLSDGHLWFSVFARPTLSSFTRTDRLTCCFVLLYMTMLINIMYYELDKTTNSGQVAIGPFILSQSQVYLK